MAVADRCWWLLAAVADGCCWLLQKMMMVAGCCGLIVVGCRLLLVVVEDDDGWWRLMVSVDGCCWLTDVEWSCWPPSVAGCWWMMLEAAGNRYWCWAPTCDVELASCSPEYQAQFEVGSSVLSLMLTLMSCGQCWSHEVLLKQDTGLMSERRGLMLKMSGLMLESQGSVPLKHCNNVVIFWFIIVTLLSLYRNNIVTL